MKVPESCDLLCQYCAKIFKSKKNLQKHVQDLHNLEEVTCNQCQKTCQNRERLRNHIGYAHTETRSKCDICEKTFSCIKNLKRHQRSHDNANNIEIICTAETTITG